MKKTDNKLEPIQTVERALQLMETLSENGSMSLNELHKVIKVNKASLLRLAYTLVQRGYLTKDEENQTYALTLKPYEIGLRAVSNIDKMSLISSTLSELSTVTGRIAQFSIEDKNDILCLQSIGQKDNLFSVYTNIGSRSPIYCTSAGKAILSSYTNSEIMERWESFDVHPLTPGTITSVQDLIADISLTRQRGYALDMEENDFNVFCIGTIVRGHTGKPVGAISLTGGSMTKEEETRLSASLLPAAQRLSSMMGYISPDL